MSGPVTMALGSFFFRAHGFGYVGLGRKLDTTWAELETAGRLNAMQWTGPRSEMVTITGVLFPKEFGGTATLEGVRLAAKSGVSLMLVTMAGKVLGTHAIQKVDEDRTHHDRYGAPARNAYTLELKRLERDGSLLSLLGVL